MSVANSLPASDSTDFAKKNKHLFPPIDPPEILNPEFPTNITLPPAKAWYEVIQRSSKLHGTLPSSALDGNSNDRLFQKTLLAPPARSHYNGFIQAGVGSDASPLLHLHYARELPQGDVATRLWYEQSKSRGNYPGFNDFHMTLAGGTFFSPDANPLWRKSRIEAHASLDLQSYPYGKPPSSAKNFPFQWEWLYDRSNLFVDYGVAIHSRENSLIDYTFALTVTHTKISDSAYAHELANYNHRSSLENIYKGQITVRKELQEVLFEGGIDLQLYSQATDWYAPSSPLFFATHVSAQKAWSERLSLKAKLTAYVFHGTDGKDFTRFYPSLSSWYILNEEWKAFISFYPDVSPQSVERQLRKHPFIFRASHAIPEIMHEDIPIRFRIGAAYDNPALCSGEVSLEYLKANSFAQIGRAFSPDFLMNPIEVWYTRYDGDPKILTMNIYGKMMLGEHQDVTLDCKIRQSYQGYSEKAIPYLPVYELRASLHSSFEFPLQLYSSFELIGRRFGETREPYDLRSFTMPAYLLIGVRAEYDYLDRFQASLSVSNLLDQRYERWDGYDARDIYLSLYVGFFF